MNILITGVHGFIGSNLVLALKDHHFIYGLDIISPPTEGVIRTFSWEELDQIPPVEIIIHLAGKAHDTKNIAEAEVYFEINTGLTQRIFNWFLKSKAKKFFFFSTVKAVAEKVQMEILTEDISPNPKGPYGESKLAAEKYIMEHVSKDKLVYILRPCMIHGPGNKGNLNMLYQLAKKGLPWPLGAFQNLRSFVSIDNLTFVIKELIERDIVPGIYQIADDEPLSTNELVCLIAQSLNRKTKIWNISPAIIRFMAKVGDTLSLPLNSERLRKLTESYVVSNAKIKIALGINRMPFYAKEGLTKTLGSFQ
jgi:nucleoside-diphosphate-sugar epimerase